MSLFFRLKSGDTVDLEILAKDIDGTIIDLTGAISIKWALFSAVNNTTEIISKTIGSGITTPTPSNGILIVSLLPADTASLSGDFRHEVQIVDSSGNVRTLSENSLLDHGRATIVADLII